MLPRKLRIPRDTLPTMRVGGKRYNAEDFFIVYKPNTLGFVRACVRVPMSISKHATVRNRIKRLYHESLRYVLPSIDQSLDVVLVAKTDISAKKMQEVKPHVLTAFLDIQRKHIHD